MASKTAGTPGATIQTTETGTGTGNEVKGAIIGAVVGIIVGGGTIFFMWKASEDQHEQLKIQQQQLVLDKERAEREREKAKEERDAARAELDRYRRGYEEAGKRFAAKLGDLIDKAVASAESKENMSGVITNAKTLVAARDDARSSLESLGAALNTEIDALKKELSKKSPDRKKIVELVRVLQGKWGVKKDEIELRTRKLETELGLVPELRKPPPSTPSVQPR